LIRKNKTQLEDLLLLELKVVLNLKRTRKKSHPRALPLRVARLLQANQSKLQLTRAIFLLLQEELKL